MVKKEFYDVIVQHVLEVDVLASSPQYGRVLEELAML